MSSSFIYPVHHIKKGQKGVQLVLFCSITYKLGDHKSDKIIT